MARDNGDPRAGAPPAHQDDGDGTITDLNTGLMWMKQNDNDLGCNSYPDHLDEDCALKWESAFAFFDTLNDIEFAGHTD